MDVKHHVYLLTLRTLSTTFIYLLTYSVDAKHHVCTLHITHPTDSTVCLVRGDGHRMGGGRRMRGRPPAPTAYLSDGPQEVRHLLPREVPRAGRSIRAGAEVQPQPASLPLHRPHRGTQDADADADAVTGALFRYRMMLLLLLLLLKAGKDRRSTGWWDCREIPLPSLTPPPTHTHTHTHLSHTPLLSPPLSPPPRPLPTAPHPHPHLTPKYKNEGS